MSSTTTTTRIFNFSAGPAVLPVEVLEEAQRDLVSLPGVGMSVLEISHRSKAFDEIIQGCEGDMRRLAGIPDKMVLSEKGAITWAPDRKKLFVGLKDQEASEPVRRDTTADEEPVAARGQSRHRR